jgi:putative PEP-CTERM system TPR-repeat lipoprotein
MRIIFIILLFSVLNFSISKARANQVENSYEKAAAAFAENNVNDAFIFVKKALQENSEHLPSKLLISKIFFDAGNLPAVEEELYEALELGADINLVLPLLGSTLIIQKKEQELLSLSKYEIKFNRQSQFEWALLKGQVALLKNNQYEAQTQFEKALTIFPSNSRSLNSLALLYLEFGWHKKAKDLIEQSLNINPNNEKTLVLKGQLLLAENKPEQALLLFEQGIAIDPHDPKILQNLAFLNLQLNNYSQVKKYTELILANSPLDPAATLISAWRMMLHDDKKLADESLAELSSVLSSLDDNNISKNKLTRFVQGVSEYLQGNNEKAQQYLLSYLNSYPGDRSALRILLEINDDETSTDKLINLLESNTKNIETDLYLGTKLVQLYLSKQKILRAESLLNKIAKTFPKHTFIIYLQATIDRARNNPKEALTLLNQQVFSEAPPLYFLLLKGGLELELNNLQSAIETAKLINATEYNNIDANNFIAAVNIKNHDFDNALLNIKKVIEVDNKNVTALFNTAILLESQKNTQAFKSLINKILLDNPQHTASLLFLSKYELSMNNIDEVIAHTNTILLYDPKNTDALELQFAAYTQAKNTKDALVIAKELLKVDRLNPAYLVAKIQLLTELLQYKEAERSINILYGLWNNNSNKLLYVSELQTKAELYQSAINTLVKAKELTTTSLSIELALANNYVRLQDKDNAIEIFARIEEKFGLSAELYLLKGDLEAFLDNNSLAFEYYRQSIELKPSNPQAIIRLYRLDKEEAESLVFIQLLESVVKDKKTPHWVRKILADSYLAQNELSKAQHHYELLLTKNRLANESSILNNLANIYAYQNLDKALLTAKKGLERGSKTPSLLDTIGWILTQKNQYNEALTYLREAFTMDSSSSTIRYHLGVTLNMLGRNKEAIKELNASLANGSGFAEYKAAKSLLELLMTNKK